MLEEDVTAQVREALSMQTLLPVILQSSTCSLVSLLPLYRNQFTSCYININTTFLSSLSDIQSD